STVVTTDANCSATFGPVSFPLPIGDTVATATATRLSPPGPLPGCVTPPPNMVSWWPGDGNANDIQDSNNGTLQGGATFAAGKVRQAFSFDGVDGSVTVPDSANLHITGPLTIDAWVNVTAVNQALNKAILWKGNNLGQDATSSYSLFILTTNKFAFEIGNGASAQLVSSTTSASPNIWTHIAAVADGSNLKIYVNGVLENTVAQTITPYSSPFSVVMGGSGLSGNFLNGLVDEVEIFNRALSQVEIQSIVNAGSAGKCKPCVTPPPNMVSWWPGDNNANDIQDGNNGTLQGGAT